MKIFKIFIPIALFIIVILLPSCAKNSDVETFAETIEITEVDENALNEDEQSVFECFIIGIEDFFNPSEVRLLEISDVQSLNATDQLPDGVKYIYLKLQGTNKLDGTLTKYYKLYLEDYTFVNDANKKFNYKKGIMDEDSIVAPICIKNSKSNAIDIGKVNKALKKHWEDMGF